MSAWICASMPRCFFEGISGTPSPHFLGIVAFFSLGTIAWKLQEEDFKCHVGVFPETTCTIFQGKLQNFASYAPHVDLCHMPTLEKSTAAIVLYLVVEGRCEAGSHVQNSLKNGMTLQLCLGANTARICRLRHQL